LIYLRYRLCLLCLASALAVPPTFAQLAQRCRLEIPRKGADKDYDLISMGTQGLALVRDMEKYAQGNKSWQVELVDTTLVSFWSQELVLDNRLQLVGYEHVPGKLYLLFRESQTTYYNFDLVVMDLVSKTFLVDKVRFDLNFQLTHFTVTGSTALFGGYIGSEAAVLLFDHASDHPKVLPGLFTKSISLLDLRANVNNSFNVLLFEKRRTDNHRLILRTYDAEGNLLVDDIMEIDDRYTLLTGKTSRLVHDEMMVVGTYGYGNGNQVYGFYAAVIDPFREQQVRFTDLAAIPHFLDYLPENRSKKIQAKAYRERTEGKDPSYSASLLPIRFDELDHGYYLLAEVFHPASNVAYYPYGNPYWSSYNSPYGTPGYPPRTGNNDPSFNTEPIQRNVEVKMIQSIVLRYRTPTADPEGVALAFDDIKRPILDQTGDFVVAGDSIVSAYKYKRDVFYQREPSEISIHGVPKHEPIALRQSGDELRDEEEAGGIRFWYGRHAYAWGYRRIRTTVNDESESRNVFYVNRLDF
jgi:hypothetical protein